MLRFDECGEEVVEAALAATTEVAAQAAEDARNSELDLPPHSAAGYHWYAFTSRREEAVTSTKASMSAGGQITAEFGSSVRRGDYALMLERLQPYLRPAFDRAAPELAARIRDILRED